MNDIVIQLTVTNSNEQALAEQGFLPADTVKTLVVEKARVNQNAKRLCLPINLIEQLGLKQVTAVDMRTETGLFSTHIYRAVQINIEGRQGSYRCVALPRGEVPLVGLIPLSDMGLEPDWDNQCLRHLPQRGKDSYITV